VTTLRPSQIETLEEVAIFEARFQVKDEGIDSWELAERTGRSRHSAARSLARLEDSGHLNATFEIDRHGPFYTYRLTNMGRSELSNQQGGRS
jgi:predicted transcriptional regulator